MRVSFVVLLSLILLTSFSQAQEVKLNAKQKKDIAAVIDQYSEARERRDTGLLKKILTNDVDQLVSTGEWRNGIDASVKGMLNSSATTPGTRTLTVDKIRLFDRTTAIVDCRYDIQNTDGTARRMWSTFVLVADGEAWKISAIRNMLPGKP